MAKSNFLLMPKKYIGYFLFSLYVSWTIVNIFSTIEIGCLARSCFYFLDTTQHNNHKNKRIIIIVVPFSRVLYVGREPWQRSKSLFIDFLPFFVVNVQISQTLFYHNISFSRWEEIVSNPLFLLSTEWTIPLYWCLLILLLHFNITLDLEIQVFIAFLCF